MRNDRDDITLTEKAKQGDTDAFRQLVERYRDVSFSLACSVLRNEHDAEDALQESFIKVYKSLHQFRSQSSFATWLYRVVLNTCINMAAKRKRPEEHVEEHTETFASDSPSGFDNLRIADRSRIIQGILNKMKTDEAIMLRLFYLSELDVTEIMEVTGFKESKVKVTLFRARKSFADAFQKLTGKEIEI